MVATTRAQSRKFTQKQATKRSQNLVPKSKQYKPEGGEEISTPKMTPYKTIKKITVTDLEKNNFTPAGHLLVILFRR